MSLLSLFFPVRLLIGPFLFASASLSVWLFIFSPESINGGRAFSFNDGLGICIEYAAALFCLWPTAKRFRKFWQNKADARLEKTGLVVPGLVIDIVKTGRLTVNMMAEHVLVVRVTDPSGLEKELRSRPFMFPEHEETIAAVRAKKISINVFFDRLNPEIHSIDTAGFDHQIFSFFRRPSLGGLVSLLIDDSIDILPSQGKKS